MVTHGTRGKVEKGSQRSFVPNAMRLFTHTFSNGSEHETVLHGRFPKGKSEFHPRTQKMSFLPLEPQKPQDPTISTDNLVEALVNFGME